MSELAQTEVFWPQCDEGCKKHGNNHVLGHFLDEFFIKFKCMLPKDFPHRCPECHHVDMDHISFIKHNGIKHGKFYELRLTQGERKEKCQHASDKINVKQELKSEESKEVIF